MSQERITTLLNENRSYLPPEHGKTSAWVCGPAEYDALCRRALEDPNDFWGAPGASFATDPLVQTLGQGTRSR